MPIPSAIVFTNGKGGRAQDDGRIASAGYAAADRWTSDRGAQTAGGRMDGCIRAWPSCSSRGRLRARSASGWR